MPGDDNTNDLWFRPTNTGPGPQTPKLPLRTNVRAKRKPRKNEPRARWDYGIDNELEKLLATAGLTPNRQIFDETVDPVPQQLSYHFYSSFRPAAHEQSPDHKSVDKVIRQTLPVETTTDVAHVPGENNIKALQVSNDTPIPAAKGSDGRRDSNLKKHLTRMQQENENATERETPIALKRRSGDIELPQAASKKPRLEGSDDSFSPKISVNVPASSRTRTQKPCVSKNIADTQRTRTALRTSIS